MRNKEMLRNELERLMNKRDDIEKAIATAEAQLKNA